MRPSASAVLRSERGYTLIELVVVVILIAILASVAITTYRSYQERAHDTAAQENIHNLVPSIQAYFVDHSGYSGMTVAGLKTAYDGAIEPAVFSLGTVAESTYCVETTAGGRTWRKDGPDSVLEPQACP